MQSAAEITYRTDEVNSDYSQYEVPIGFHIVKIVSVVQAVWRSVVWCGSKTGSVLDRLRTSAICGQGYD